MDFEPRNLFFHCKYVLKILLIKQDLPVSLSVACVKQQPCAAAAAAVGAFESREESSFSWSPSCSSRTEVNHLLIAVTLYLQCLRFLFLLHNRDASSSSSLSHSLQPFRTEKKTPTIFSFNSQSAKMPLLFFYFFCYSFLWPFTHVKNATLFYSCLSRCCCCEFCTVNLFFFFSSQTRQRR